MRRIPNGLKIQSFPMENLFFPIYWYILKFEEMGYLIHCAKFRMWPALSYVNSPFISHSSIDSKLGFLIVGLSLYLDIFSNLKKDWKIGYLNVALGWISQFFQILEGDVNWDFQMMTNRPHFQIFPNSLERCKSSIFEY